MSHHEDNSNLSPAQIHYNEYITMGDNFMNIHIYRSAKEWYNKALDLNVDNPTVQAKLADCNTKTKSESNTIIKVVVAAAVIILAVVLINYL